MLMQVPFGTQSVDLKCPHHQRRLARPVRTWVSESPVEINLNSQADICTYRKAESGHPECSH